MAYNPWRDLKKLRREVWVLAGAALANRMGTMVLPFLALYLTHLGYTAAQAGLALGAFGLGSLLTAPFAGKLSDRLGPFSIMRASLALSGALVFVIPFVRGFVPILLSIFLWSVLAEAYRPASLAVLTEFAPPEFRRAAFALNRLAINLGMSIGPAVAGFLVTVSFPAIFLIDGATSLLAAGILALTLRGKPSSRPCRTEDIGDALSVRAMRNPRFLLYLLGLLPMGLVFFQHVSTFPLFLVRDVGLPASAFGLLFSVNTVLIILLEVPLNTAMARWPHRIALPLGALLVGGGFAAIRFATGFWTAAATVVIWTFGEMVILPGSAAATADMAPEARRGEYMGLYAMVFSLSMIVGPWGGMFILDRLGPDALWGGALLLGLLSAFLLTLKPIWKR
jgi:MFS family permease